MEVRAENGQPSPYPERSASPYPEQQTVYVTPNQSYGVPMQPMQQPQTVSYGYGQQPATIVHVHTGAPPAVMTAATVGSDKDLDHHFRTCCCHVKTAVYVIGILEAVALVISFITNISLYVSCDDYYTYCYIYYDDMIITIIATLLGGAVIGLLIYGTVKTIPGMLIPHIVFQIIAAVGCAIGVVYYILLLAGVAIVLGDEYTTVIFVIPLIFLAVALGVECYFTHQCIRCYRYLVAKRHRRY